jgi:hypothetical protein
LRPTLLWKGLSFYGISSVILPAVGAVSKGWQISPYGLDHLMAKKGLETTPSPINCKFLQFFTGWNGPGLKEFHLYQK